MDKTLTIIVPSYNMEKYLSKCLGSLIVDDTALLRQLDVIVVNDGSTDRTSALAHEWAQKYPDVIRVIDKPNGHYGSCINAALPEALGEYIRILDADDSVDSEMLADFIPVVSSCAGAQVDVIITDTVCVDDSNRVVRKIAFPYIPKGESAFSTLPKRITEDFNLQAPFAFRTKMLRAMQYRQTEGIPYTDAEWATLPFAAVRRVHYCPSPLYRYLVGREGQSMDVAIVRKSYWMSARTALNCLRQLLSLRQAAESANEAYVLDRCERMLISTYLSAILAVHTQDSDRVLSEFDDELKRLSECMYQRIGQKAVAAKGHFPYVRIWRTKKSSRHPLLVTFRLLQELLLWCRGREG